MNSIGGGTGGAAFGSITWGAGDPGMGAPLLLVMPNAVGSNGVLAGSTAGTAFEAGGSGNEGIC